VAVLPWFCHGPRAFSMALCWGLLARRFRERLPKHYRDKCVHVFNLAASATIFVKTATGSEQQLIQIWREYLLIARFPFKKFSKIPFQKKIGGGTKHNLYIYI